MKVSFLKFFIIPVIMLLIAGCTRHLVETANQKTIESFDRIRLSDVLNELIQLDIDTFHAYGQAMHTIKNQKFREKLLEFQNDHKRHVTTLSKAVLDLGEHPPDFSADFKGFLTLGYVTVKGAVSIRSTLEAMETNEIISNKYYGKALLTPMPANIKAIIESHKRDEERHLNDITQMKAESGKK